MGETKLIKIKLKKTKPKEISLDIRGGFYEASRQRALEEQGKTPQKTKAKIYKLAP